MRTTAKAADVSIRGGKLEATLSGNITGIDVDLQTGSVGEIVVTVDDPGAVLSRGQLVEPGAVLTVDGVEWVVTNHEVAMADGSGSLTARSPVARTLRRRVKSGSDQRVSPHDWIERRVKAAGGTSDVAASAVRQTITQSRGQSELDVIASLCSDMGWVFSEYGGHLVAGAGYRMLTEDSRATWPVEFNLQGYATDERYEVLDVSGGLTADDSEATGRVSVSVPAEMGAGMLPLHRLYLRPMFGRLSGFWLIDGVKRSLDGVSPATITATIPRKTSPKKGSSGDGTLSIGVDVGEQWSGENYTGETVPGYATRVYNGCTRTPKRMVEWALSQVGVYRDAGYCLSFVDSAGGLHQKEYAKEVWYQRPAGALCGPRDPNAPRGSVVLWYGPNKAGHIAISLGGGKVVTTTSGPVSIMGLFEYIGKDPYYLGWMVPSL